MAALTDEQLWEMSDEELEAAYREAKMGGASVEDLEESSDDTEEIDLEQPEADSDDDTSSEEEVEVAETEDSTEVEGDADEVAETEDEQTEDTEAEAEAEEQPVANDDEELTFRADGQDYKFTVKEMKEQFGRVFGQAMNYTKKMQALKPYRQTIDALDSAKLSYEDVNLMIDALKGNKDALSTVIKRAGVDALELDTEQSKPYVPRDYGRNETELEIKDIIDEISVDREYTTTHHILEKQWDDASRMEFVKDPSLIKALHVDVKSGMYDTINPIAQKMKLYDGAKQSDLEYYKMAASKYFEDTAQNEQKVSEQRRQEAERVAAEAKRVSEAKAKQREAEAVKEAASKRKAATLTKKVTTGSKSLSFDDSDEAFEDWYLQNVTNKQ